MLRPYHIAVKPFAETVVEFQGVWVVLASRLLLVGVHDTIIIQLLGHGGH